MNDIFNIQRAQTFCCLFFLCRTESCKGYKILHNALQFKNKNPVIKYVVRNVYTNDKFQNTNGDCKCFDFLIGT